MLIPIISFDNSTIAEIEFEPCENPDSTLRFAGLKYNCDIKNTLIDDMIKSVTDEISQYNKKIYINEILLIRSIDPETYLPRLGFKISFFGSTEHG